MSYLVTARKYRPQLFEELVGQEHIATTLKNAISKGKIGHAYLFSGSRGVGKTSAARIFAKALNCEHGPTPTPCNKCVYCREITEGKSLDLVEIDGASNRGIDEIRQLRENVKFVPTSSRYKVYIIDEVHMLTKEAFNALLKTLEEPPEHVVFILATTAPHKVPATIRSRCQQFIFKSIPIPLIVDTMKKIIADLGVVAEEKALFWIAKSATGSMRDAESMLDQLISYTDGKITLNDVFDVLGLPKFALYHRIADAISKEDFRECFKILDGMIKDGVEIEIIITGLIEYFRNLYLLSVSDNSEELVDLPEEDVSVMKEFLKKFDRKDINNLLLILTKLYQDSRGSEIARYLLEITFIKMVYYKQIINPSEILLRLENLEKRLSNSHEDSHSVGRVEKEIKNSESALLEERTSKNMDFANTIGKKSKNKMDNVLEQISYKNENTINTEFQKGNFDDKNEENLLNKIVKALMFKRRAIAEFLQRADRYSLDNNILNIYFSKSEKLGYEHLNDENVKKELKREIAKILGKDIILEFHIENGDNSDKDETEVISPKIEKVLQIFKGEIINNKANGGS